MEVEIDASCPGTVYLVRYVDLALQQLGFFCEISTTKGYGR